MASYLDHNATSPMHPEVVGALVVNRKPRQLLISGGDQENRRRGVTENVAGIVGLGKAAELARLEIDSRRHYLLQLRDFFESRLAGIPGSVVFGQQASRLPNTTYLRCRTITARPC